MGGFRHLLLILIKRVLYMETNLITDTHLFII